jgi:hypothetical protein
MFIYSLPLFFTYTGLATPIELLMICVGVFIILFIASPAYKSKLPNLVQDNYLLSAWKGESSLIAVFWPFFLILNAYLYGVDTLAKAGYITVSSWDDLHLIMLLPVIWWTTSVWRCSAATHSRIWAAGARLMTISVFFEYGLKILIRADYPRLFFNCEELLLDYGSCF